MELNGVYAALVNKQMKKESKHAGVADADSDSDGMCSQIFTNQRSS